MSGSHYPEIGTIYNVESLFIEFTRPSKDVAFVMGRDNSYNSLYVDIYQADNQLIASVLVNFGGSLWSGIALNQYSQTIKKVVLRRIPPTSGYSYGHIYLDNFQFTPIITTSPEGYLDGVNLQSGKAFGWSRDPDDLSASNRVHCFVDGPPGQGTFIGEVLANIPSNDVGNHRFEMDVPIHFRDGVQRQMWCYGLDAVGGDPPFKLNGSPKTFKFNAPIGYLDEVTTDTGEAVGWSKDPDQPNLPNQVHFYINAPAGNSGSSFIGETTANVYRPDVGSHGFRFEIPSQFRDGIARTIYAYGMDLTGDAPKLLPDPKVFTLNPVVQSTTFAALSTSPLDINPNVGGGLRIYPDRLTPTDSEFRNTVEVKVRISSPIANVPVYFQSFDLDEPSTNSLPLDTSNDNNGNDNRAFLKRGAFICPEGVCDLTVNNIYKTQTNANGEASLTFVVSSAHPGDNFIAAASTRENDLLDANIINQDSDIRNSTNNRTFQIGVNRTEMLTVWRRLHIEIDSMGIVEYNAGSGSVTQTTEVGTNPVEIPVLGFLDAGRFENGRMIVGGNTLYVDSNTIDTVTVRTPAGTVIIPNRARFTLYDDDDFNSNNILNGFDADNGEDITALNDSLNLLRDNDDKDCSDGNCNVFAAAYIRPEYGWATPYNTSNIPFIQNVPTDDPSTVEEQVDRGRYPNSGENDNFWVAYIQIAYQGPTNLDCDSNVVEHNSDPAVWAALHQQPIFYSM